jgi:hypothetical protein
MNKRPLWIVTLLFLAIGTFAEAQQAKKGPSDRSSKFFLSSSWVGLQEALPPVFE